MFAAKGHHKEMKRRDLAQEGHAAAQPQSQELMLRVLSFPRDEVRRVGFFVESRRPARDANRRAGRTRHG